MPTANSRLTRAKQDPPPKPAGFGRGRGRLHPGSPQVCLSVGGTMITPQVAFLMMPLAVLPTRKS